jgi:hypothetical protein
MRRHFLAGTVMLLGLTLVLGFGYPLLVTGLSALLFRHQADGSPVYLGGKLAGSWSSCSGACPSCWGPAPGPSGPTFAAFLLGVIVIVGGLIYFPMLILGPIGERMVG